MSMSVSKVQIAVHTVMWLGSGQQLKHVNINDIPLLSTTVQVIKSAWDLGFILGSQLTLSAHIAALCQSGYYQLRQLCPLVDSMSCKNRSCGVYFLPVGLLQFAALRSAGHTTAQAAVCAEYHCTTNHWHTMQWSYLAGITRTPLATHLRVRQVQSGMPGSPVAVRAGSSLLGRRLPSCVRQHLALSAVSWCFDAHGAVNIQ